MISYQTYLVIIIIIVVIIIIVTIIIFTLIIFFLITNRGTVRNPYWNSGLLQLRRLTSRLATWARSCLLFVFLCCLCFLLSCFVYFESNLSFVYFLLLPLSCFVYFDSYFLLLLQMVFRSKNFLISLTCRISSTYLIARKDLSCQFQVVCV